MNITDKFIKIISDGSNKLTEKAEKQAVRCLIDYVGTAFAGSYMRYGKNDLYLNQIKSSSGTSVIGTGKRSDIYTSALLNGMNSHETELDDGHRLGMLHLASPVISALLPVAESEKVNGKALIKGIVAGYETSVRTACSVQPYHNNRGYHTTGTCGTLGAAIGIGIMLNYTNKQLKATLSAAVSSAAGVLGVLDDASELKPYNAGRASMDGIAAAYTGKITEGPDDILGGRRGFLAIYGDKTSPEILVEPITDPFAIEKIYIKPYASCRHCHSALEAADISVKQNKIDLNAIKSIDIDTYENAVIRHGYKKIHGMHSAKMSIPYNVAVMLAMGHVDIQSFSEKCIADDTVNSLLNKISVNVNPELTAIAPKIRASIVTVTTYDDEKYSIRVDYPKGEPENPMTDDEIDDKFIRLMIYANITQDKARFLLNALKNVSSDCPQIYDLLI